MSQMIRIEFTRKRHPSRASCEIAGHRFETQGPAPIYKLATLLWLHGHRGERFEVWDDVSPFGRPGGLAMRGRIRNWALLVKGKPNFTRKAKPDSDFIPDEREVIARAAGTVMDLAKAPAASGLKAAGRATRPSDGPDYPRGQDGASTRVFTARPPEAA